jgi:lipopolysaccharide transport system ATP-binding protein
MEPIIKVEDLSKQYRINASISQLPYYTGISEAPYTSLREALAGAIRAPLKRLQRKGHPRKRHSKDEAVWALKDVSFEVQQGDIIGIIGRNGSGKSTLLKVLSRIVEPSTGRIEVYGRAGSLLEVGTGFHPELTGRENIYLNGAVLGMKRSEIDRTFDEIVAFAELEKFLDTPVKHYSSGMYTRLGFAVAAHLQPEILIVDEVLAVGDEAFQKKSLGKMREVAKEGQTVLFVSHNMGSIVSLCDRCLWLDNGILTQDGPASEVTARYQTSFYSSEDPLTNPSNVEKDLSKNSKRRYGTGKARFTSIKVTPLGVDGSPQRFVRTGQDLRVDLKIVGLSEITDADVALTIYDSAGDRLIDANTAIKGSFLSLKQGQEARIQFQLRNVLLRPGVYLLGLWLGRGASEDIDALIFATSFRVEADQEAMLHADIFPGPYQCAYTHNMHII